MITAALTQRTGMAMSRTLRSPREPIHCTIVTLDIEGFGSPTRTDPIRAEIAAKLSAIVASIVDIGDVPLLEMVDTGDGKGLFFGGNASKPRVVEVFSNLLEAELRQHNRSASTAAQIRLRVGVHHGDVVRRSDGALAGDALNHTFRIIDNAVLRQILKATSRNSVMAISDDFFDRIVRQEFGSLDPTRYSPVAISIKETETTVWVEASDVSVLDATTLTAMTAELPREDADVPPPKVLTLQDLPAASLYLPTTDFHNMALYAKTSPDAPVALHIETALLLADKAVLHSADAYRSRKVAEVLDEFKNCIVNGDLLFLLGENTRDPRSDFRGYIDFKVHQYGKSNLGERDVHSLTDVDENSADRTEELLGLSPFALIRGFSGGDAFVRFVKRDLQIGERITICDHYASSIIGSLGLSLRQLLDLAVQNNDDSITRLVADEKTIGRLQGHLEILSGHNSFSRQILMAAIREATGLTDDDPLTIALEERVSLLHISGTTGSMAHTEVTSRRDRLSLYFHGYLMEHLSTLSETQHPDRFGANLVMELRALPAWPYFSAHHLRIVGDHVHRLRSSPATGDLEAGYMWSRRVPAFEPIRGVVRRHWRE